MGSTRQTAGLPAIDVTSICDAALKLTKEFGIDGWSIRQLAKEINAYPGVINYHVGRREDVVHLVIEHVNAEIDLPEPRENWKRWFKLLLEGMRSTLRKYPGVARRLAAVGPGLGESDRIINCGIQVLRDAGFGDWSTLVYSVLLCQTCAFVATEDDRDKMDDVRKEVGGSYASALSASDPGIAAANDKRTRLFAKGLIRYPADGYVYDAGHFSKTCLYVFRRESLTATVYCVFQTSRDFEVAAGIPHR